MQCFPLAPDLRVFVKDVVLLKDTNTLPVPPQRLLPDGNFMLVLNLENGYLTQMPDQTYEAGKTAVGYLHTQANSAFQLQKIGAYRGIILHFSPDGLYHLLRTSLADLPMNAILTTEELFGKWGKQLAERLCEFSTPTLQIAFLEKELRHKFNKVGYTTDAMTPLLAWIEEKKGKASVQAMAEAHCMSRKTLERRFQQRVGILPKQYLRIIRFRHAYSQLCLGKYHEMMDLVVDNGYFDQMHMIKEFKQFVNTTPAELAKANQQLQQSYHAEYRKLEQAYLSDHILK